MLRSFKYHFYLKMGGLVFLVSISIAVKRHHDHATLTKKTFNFGGLLSTQRFNPLSTWKEARQHSGLCWS